ncbi:MauE/DoxX family redox-associated membrane protein [Streptomyces hygroscopicus]|uniref:MauE/DoxX family redox-associated membrane protein n=1 Tax=Streptomyces hygroscopicus TaxID=1912 RepID=UPI0033E59639
MTLDVTPMALLVAALLFHQLNRYWEYGFSHVGRHYAPVFAIRLPRAAAIFGQAVALPLALLTALAVPYQAGHITVVLLVAFWVLATHQRLSNHCCLGSVATAVVAFTPAHLHAAVARDLLTGVYLTAALLKVNDEHLLTDRSASRVVTAHYFRLLRLPVPPGLLTTVPFAVVAVEFAIGILLLVPGGEPWGLWIALLMHLAFGVSGNFPFSVVAMALWVTAFLSDDRIEVPGGAATVWSAALLTGMFALAAGRTATGRRSRRWLLKDFFEGAVYGVLCSIAVLSAGHATVPVTVQTTVADWLVALGFALNFLLVVAGVKLEWSFAMFTSLRPFGRSWLERYQTRDWPRYYALTLPARIPTSLLREIGPEFIYAATRPRNIVHEGVVYHLEATARKYDVSFAPREMTADPLTRELVPVPGDPSRSAPRRRMLTHPAIAPRSLDDHYLG